MCSRFSKIICARRSFVLVDATEWIVHVYTWYMMMGSLRVRERWRVDHVRDIDNETREKANAMCERLSTCLFYEYFALNGNVLHLHWHRIALAHIFWFSELPYTLAGWWMYRWVALGKHHISEKLLELVCICMRASNKQAYGLKHNEYQFA